ncbi:hypothetical protein C7E19_22630, partial [Stenotrophomonas maltophilia]
DLDLAVAFWGHDASAFLGLAKTRRRVRIVLEISQGATNIKEVRKLLKMPQVEVKSYERLHAKAYISANEVIIGSANASAGGLGIVGFENKHWKELGIQTRSKEVIQRTKSWFEELWLAAEKISPSELDRIEKLQKGPRQTHPSYGLEGQGHLRLLQASSGGVERPQHLDHRGHLGAV